MRNVKHFRLKEEGIKNVINEYKEGYKLKEISKRHNISTTTINAIVCYYNGRNNRTSEGLSDYYRSVVDSIKNDANIIEKQSCTQEYEANIFFGLIKIRIKPVKNKNKNKDEQRTIN